ncbi:hypothetical protein JCM21142_3952 [Saccharicrinis fermentans DSM 9555 = JCM 21142]|uniref:Uncharacterized protein n=1 Tax=Saccharicrinis fermentans DSM 9555 = JCM 21142 TaxID=869213 RepID=W7Y417_9BACT|nr:hypothetical protein JCM21142_3952 [Saccharicrinis fermentans DSM 9555 = JCM 21142]
MTSPDIHLCRDNTEMILVDVKKKEEGGAFVLCNEEMIKRPRESHKFSHIKRLNQCYIVY